MYRKKYNPEESLQRIKLMMGYSLNDTLKENAKNLGVLLSEQLDISGDIRDINDEIKNFNSDEDLLVTIIKKYNNKSDFQKMLNAYKERYNVDLGIDLHRAIGTNDKTESAEIIKHLGEIGITAKTGPTGDKRGTFGWFFEMGDGKNLKQVSPRQQNINNIFCSVKDGIIVNPTSKSNGKTWESWKSVYKVTDAEIEIAKKSCGGSDKITRPQPQIPEKLKDIDGVKKFQDWLDDNVANWADGFKNGKLEGGPGYGRFGPRTQRQWNNKDVQNKFLNKGQSAEKTPATTTEPEVPSEVVTINPQSDF
jgi:hypothetical protein